MAYRPCINPNCKSHGVAHPNCKCFLGMADGGEVGYCNGPHKNDCQYFSDGGQVQEGFISDSEVTPDTGFVPDNEVAADYNPENVPGFIPEDEAVKSKFESPMQQGITALEGLAQGIAGPLATLAETKLLGVPEADIVARQEANPILHGASSATGLIGSAFIPGGQAAVVAKIGAKATQAMNMGKVGAAIIGNAISNGVIQAGDEVSKWMLGQGDPADGVGAKLANIGAAGLIGGAFGTAGVATKSIGKKALSEIAESQFGQRAEFFLNGVADAMSGKGKESAKTLAGVSKSAYLAGLKAFDSLGTAGAVIETVRNAQSSDNILKDMAKGYVAGWAAKKAAPAVLKVLGSGNLTGAFQAFDHAAEMAAGSKMIDKALDGVFKAGSLGAQSITSEIISHRDRKKLEEYLENGGIDSEIEKALQEQNAIPQFAEGGEVEAPEPTILEPNGVETHYPEQNILLSAARGRISNYLNSLRPTPNAPKLAFDEEPEDEEKKQTYNRAIDIALNPLSIMNEIKAGTIEPEHVQHFNNLYPEMQGLLQKRITQKIIDMQIEGETPDYKVRQGLSMFMGTALSGDITPEGIQAAQSVYAAKQAQQQPQQAPKSSSNKSKLSKSDQSFLTNNQALTGRSQKQ